MYYKVMTFSCPNGLQAEEYLLHEYRYKKAPTVRQIYMIVRKDKPNRVRLINEELSRNNIMSIVYEEAE